MGAWKKCALSAGKTHVNKIPPFRGGGGYFGFLGGGWYMREIGTMWQIGVLTGKPCTFLVQNGSVSAFWHYKNNH